jgi:hypothetical protein
LVTATILRTPLVVSFAVVGALRECLRGTSIRVEAYFERAARSSTSTESEVRPNQGNPQQAYDLLAPVCGWYTGGFETRDLKEAKSFLNQLTA